MSEETKQPESTGTSTEYGYRVEARNKDFSKLLPPVELSDGFLGSEWRELRFQTGTNPAGIPLWTNQKFLHDLLPFNAATALAWTVIAQHPFCKIECRLVKFKLEHTHKLWREEAGENIKSAFE